MNKESSENKNSKLIVTCVDCGRELSMCNFAKHYKTYHSDLSEIELSKLHFLNNPKLDKLGIEFIEYIFAHDIVKTFKECYQYITKMSRSYNSFIGLVEAYREYSKSDIEIYFDFYLPYRKKHPGVNNSLELCVVLCAGDEELGKDYYEKLVKPKNAFTGHGGELSPWSKDFVAYKDKSEDEKTKLIRNRIFCKDREDFAELKKNSSTCLEFYLNQGLSEEEAKKKLSERQSTFSLEKCIQKYGEEEGIERFKARQEKWLNSLDTPENREKLKQGRIKGLSLQWGRTYSKISQELFDGIRKKLDRPDLTFYYATSGLDEYVVNVSPVKAPMLDFYIPELNKWIEFDGDYWHGEGRGNKERDRKREETILNAMPNVELKRVRERDFKQDPDKVIAECVQWIEG